MIQVLRNEESGICRGCSAAYPTASSQVSALSTSARPSCHWFTGTPDPAYSYFKPFIFHPCIGTASSKTISPDEKPRKHLLYVQHEKFYDKLKQDQESHQTLRQLEATCIDELEQLFVSSGNNVLDWDTNEIDTLFKDSVESELRFYK